MGVMINGRDRHWLIDFFRWDARATLAAALGLLVLIGFAWAATSGSVIATFDFGGAAASDLAVGAIQVKGAATQYPTTAGTLQYGWRTAEMFESVDKTVADRLNRDSNSGVNGAEFWVSGLEADTYSLAFMVGASDKVFSTKITSGAQATSVTTTPSSWKTANLSVAVDNSGILKLVFSSANGSNEWGVCSLVLSAATGVMESPSFAVAVSPPQVTIRPGDTVAFSVGVTPLQNYANGVSAEVAGLVTGMTAEFMPAQLTNLPGTIELLLYTAKTVPPAIYNLNILVRGNDVAATQKYVTVRVAVTTTGTSGDSGLSNTTTDSSSDSSSSPNGGLPPRTAEEIGADFDEIEAFAEEQQAKALQQKNFLELGDIGSALSGGVPVLTGLPEAKTATESILQKLVNNGIIGVASDAAPPVQMTPKPPGFWQRVIEGIFSPAN